MVLGCVSDITLTLITTLIDSYNSQVRFILLDVK